MSVKQFSLEDVGTIYVYKRKGAKSLRLSIAADGKVRVTIPTWATYVSGVEFAQSKSTWIAGNLPEVASMLQHGDRIGKAHKLVFESGKTKTVKTRIAGSEIRVTRPANMLMAHPDMQKAAHQASLRALRTQAQKLLPVRLKHLAETYGFTYADVQIKQLKGRWGSCDTHKHITLNLFLMQLPWHLIDYVLIHELVHTKHLDHSDKFWNEFIRHEPRAKSYRSVIRTYKPILTPNQ